MNDASEHEENRYTVRQTKGGKTKREAKERNRARGSENE